MTTLAEYLKTVLEKEAGSRWQEWARQGGSTNPAETSSEAYYGPQAQKYLDASTIDTAPYASTTGVEDLGNRLLLKNRTRTDAAEYLKNKGVRFMTARQLQNNHGVPISRAGYGSSSMGYLHEPTVRNRLINDSVLHQLRDNQRQRLLGTFSPQQAAAWEAQKKKLGPFLSRTGGQFARYAGDTKNSFRDMPVPGYLNRAFRADARTFQGETPVLNTLLNSHPGSQVNTPLYLRAMESASSLDKAGNPTVPNALYHLIDRHASGTLSTEDFQVLIQKLATPGMKAPRKSELIMGKLREELAAEQGVSPNARHAPDKLVDDRIAAAKIDPADPRLAVPNKQLGDGLEELKGRNLFSIGKSKCMGNVCFSDYQPNRHYAQDALNGDARAFLYTPPQGGKSVLIHTVKNDTGGYSVSEARGPNNYAYDVTHEPAWTAKLKSQGVSVPESFAGKSLAQAQEPVYGGRTVYTKPVMFRKGLSEGLRNKYYPDAGRYGVQNIREEGDGVRRITRWPPPVDIDRISKPVNKSSAVAAAAPTTAPIVTPAPSGYQTLRQRLNAAPGRVASSVVNTVNQGAQQEGRMQPVYRGLQSAGQLAANLTSRAGQAAATFAQNNPRIATAVRGTGKVLSAAGPFVTPALVAGGAATQAFRSPEGNWNRNVGQNLQANAGQALNSYTADTSAVGRLKTGLNAATNPASWPAAANAAANVAGTTKQPTASPANLQRPVPAATANNLNQNRKQLVQRGLSGEHLQSALQNAAQRKGQL